jgi:hypothetical protein
MKIYQKIILKKNHLKLNKNNIKIILIFKTKIIFNKNK